MFVGGIGDGIAAIFILAGLGMVFVSGAIIALFLKVIGMASGRALLWGFGVPLVGLTAMSVLIPLQVQEPEEEAEPITIPYPPGGLNDDRG